MNEANMNEIISRYPYPIAILYRIIAGMDLKEEPGKGLDYILQTAEATARMLGMIALAELVLLKEKQENVEIPDSIQNDFKKNIKRPSFGHWLNFAREGFRYLKDTRAEIVILELKDLFYEGKKETEFKTALDKLIKLRNALSHHKIVLDTIDKQQSAVNISLNYLHIALKHLEFLKEVSFGYIKSIEVNKKRRHDPEYLHKGITLKGDSIAKGINLSSVLDGIKETDTVIIRYDEKTYLNLYPFYIYDESSGDAADVFFYNGRDDSKLEYIGIDPGGKFSVRNKKPEKCQNLDEEFDCLITGQKQRKENVKYSQELHEEFDHITTLLA